jgi:sortase A
MGREARLGGIWRLAERVAWALALGTLAVWTAANVAGRTGAVQDIKRFEAAKSATAAASPDLSLWDAERIREWRASLTQPAPPPLGILRIPKLHLEVAILPGTDEFVLNRGVGHIDDTAMPGADGNAGIAGHRDGFFRGLKDIAAGDAIDLETRDGHQTYLVERTWIVQPEDVSVLDPTPARSLTLVTCYPFYFIGPAPQRFIVRAVRAEPGSLVRKP